MLPATRIELAPLPGGGAAGARERTAGAGGAGGAAGEGAAVGRAALRAAP
jgi:hypothetical protein